MSRTRIVRLTADRTDPQVHAAIASLSELRGEGILRSTAGVHLPGSYGQGDATRHLTTDEHVKDLELVARILARHHGLLAPVWDVPVGRVLGRQIDPRASAVRRTLLVRLRAGTTAAERDQWCRDMSTLPDHVPEIGRWPLSEIEQHHTWTHVVEHWVDSAAALALSGSYMRSPAHITLVDRHFEPEQPGGALVAAFDHSFYTVLPAGAGSMRASSSGTPRAAE